MASGISLHISLTSLGEVRFFEFDASLIRLLCDVRDNSFFGHLIG